LNPLRSKKILFVLFLLIACAYIIPFFLLPAKGFWICDNGTKFIQMKSMIISGYKGLSIVRTGTDFLAGPEYSPMQEPFFTHIDSKVYGVFSNLFVFLSSVMFQVFGFRGLYVIPLLSFFLLIPVVWKIAGLFSFPKLTQLLSLVLVSLCTPVWFYSLTFWEHLTATAIIVWGIYFYLYYFLKKPNFKYLLYSAALCSLSIYFRDELLIIPIALNVSVLIINPRYFKKMIMFNLIALATILPFFIFNWIAFSNPLGVHVTSISPLSKGISLFLSDRLFVFKRLLLNSHENVLLSVVLNLAFVFFLLFNRLIPVRKLRYAVIVSGIFAAMNGIVILLGYFTTENKFFFTEFTNGLSSTVPFLIFAFIFIKKDIVEKTVWLTVLFYILIYVLLSPAKHCVGIHWGCRYLLAVYPLLGVMASASIAQWFQKEYKTRTVSIVVIICVSLAFLLQVYSIHLLYQRKITVQKLNYEVLLRPVSVVVSNNFLSAIDLAPIFYDKEIFLAQYNKLPEFNNFMRGRGVRNIIFLDYPYAKIKRQSEFTVIKNDCSYPFIIETIKLNH